MGWVTEILRMARQLGFNSQQGLELSLPHYIQTRSYSISIRSFLSGVKWLECEDDHTHPPSAAVRNDPLPHLFLHYVVFKHKDITVYQE
jgi:hypothetical protein